MRDGNELLDKVPFGLVVKEGDALYPLTRGGAYLLLGKDGLHVGAKYFAQKSRYVAYEDITHVVPARRGLWLGTRRSLETISRGRRTEFDSAAVARQIETRIARRPGGAEQLSRMRANDRRLHSGGHRWVTGSVVLICILFHVLQIRDAYLTEVGMFVGELVGQGEWWRVLTSQFLHQLGLPLPSSADSTLGQLWLFGMWQALGRAAAVVPIHIALNSALAMLFGYLVELQLGARRTLVILGAAGLCAACGSGLANEQMVGASGLVLGLAGAALALELQMPERLPAPWRLPRTLFILVLVGEAIVGFGTAFIAGAAHLGGFAGGYLATRVLAEGSVHARPVSLGLRAAAVAVVVGAMASFVALTPLALRLPYAMNEHADHLLDLSEVGAGALNDLAWRIATESDAMPDRGDRALALAERAVEQTGRSNPDFLDTLAEVQFMGGDAEAAVLTIDEALDLAPWDDYFREQRNRFTGERAADDRPTAPPGRWNERGPREFAPWDDGEGIAI